MVPVRLPFRAKLLAIVGIMAVAFLLLIAAGSVIAGRVDRQLTAIQSRYLPKAELEPELTRQLERLQRGFQDAVAAHDTEALAATLATKAKLVDLLVARKDALDPADVAALEAAVEDYYSAGHDVSRRLIAGETGEALVGAIGAMQGKQTRVKELIAKAAALDQHELTQAFAAAVDAEASATSSRLAISVVCLLSAIVLSMALSRSLLRSVAEVTAGFRRFGAGDFHDRIRVTSTDELGAIAAQANEMAASLERLDRERTKAETALVLSNRELEAFSYSVAHDLRAPLRGINGFSRALLEDLEGRLDHESQDYLRRIAGGAERMGQLIDALLALSRVTRAPLERQSVNLTRVADTVVAQLRAADPDRLVEFVSEEGVAAHGDPTLLRAVLDNLIGNAWKFTRDRSPAHISFATARREGEVAYVVRDDGAGFDMAYAEKLFAPFQRLHAAEEFAGTGVGLATVQRIVHRHGGRIWAEGAVGKGASFQFTLAAAAAEGASR
jgi:signal transduction histidine kinase